MTGLVEFRCPECTRLIFTVSPRPGIEVEVACLRCSSLVKAVLADESDGGSAGDNVSAVA